MTTVGRADTYLVVGRDSGIDLEKYLVTIRGRKILDYEKLRREEPELYWQIIRNEEAANAREERAYYRAHVRKHNRDPLRRLLQVWQSIMRMLHHK